MIIKVVIVIAVLFVAFAVFAALQPPDFRIERSAVIAASPAAVFAEINDLHRFQAWNPWAKIDPSMKSTFAGPAAGVGAAYTWAGNNQVGEGHMTIVDSQPGQRVRLRMDFLKPLKSTSTAEFTLAPASDGTAVTWSMYGQRNFVAKAIGLLVSMDAMVGGSFEQGLRDLKSIVEARSAQ